MAVGVLFAVLACLCWGLIFVVPFGMEQFSDVEVVLARYLFLGGTAFLCFLYEIVWKRRVFPGQYWARAFVCGFAVNLLYYFTIVFALRLSDPAVTTIIASGLAPALLALYSYLRLKESDLRTILWPSLAIFIGVCLVNIPPLLESYVERDLNEYFLGIGSAAVALIIWVTYIITNSAFLKREPISSYVWSNMLGVTTLFWTILFALFHYQAEVNPAFWEMFFDEGSDMTAFWVGGFLLGVVAGWLGTLFWSSATRRLSMTVTGPLLILETLFGIMMVYSYEQTFPPPIEAFGIVLMLGSVLWTTKAFLRRRPAIEL